MFDKLPETKYNNDLNIDNKFEPFMYALFDCIIDPETRRYQRRLYSQTLATNGWRNLARSKSKFNVGHYTFNGNVRKMLTGEARVQTRIYTLSAKTLCSWCSLTNNKNNQSQGKIQISKKNEKDKCIISNKTTKRNAG